MAMRYHVSRTIAAPVEKVWSLLTDASTYGAWNTAVISIEGTIEKGETISLVSIVNPKRSFNLKVVEMAAPNRMVWSDGMPLGLFRGDRTYELSEREGSTYFSMTEEYTGLLAPLFTKTIPDMTESFDLFADGLKNAAEAASGYS
jgi:uncharacterized protein YndB with AHSA1/START domain